MRKEARLIGNTIHKGNSSEAVVLTAYARAGFLISLPFGGGSAYDLIVDTGTRLLKVQVKTGWHSKGCLLYKGRRRVRDIRQNGMRRYRSDEVDFFAVYDPNTDNIYVVPPTAMGVDGCLRLEPVLNGQQKLIRWARDFTWEKHVAGLQAELLPADYNNRGS
ncbi:MAG TPA: group I intron-associated PD-(D/E)XK endonuclease [Blastocatellia bacterium]|nr:group I intron-associated PD-(D/E)XK endonuclease [Blastocatellia bacterium]